MILTETNPPWLDADAYIAFLNGGFKNQWDRNSFRWYLRRPFNGRGTDIVVRSEGADILAGAAFCYRQVAGSDGAPLDVCIMSAGTTKGGERRRGHYAALLEAGIELCRKRACAALLGFVTRDNGSARGLLQIGAYAVPTHYLAFDPSICRNRGKQSKAPRRVSPDELTVLLSNAGGLPPTHDNQHLRFHYPSFLDWLQQFVFRTHHVSGYRLAHDALALVETVGDTDRLQWLSCPLERKISHIATLAAASRRLGRRFFMYSTDALLADAAARTGARERGGYLMVLPIEMTPQAHALGSHRWALQSGDRM